MLVWDILFFVFVLIFAGNSQDWANICSFWPENELQGGHSRRKSPVFEMQLVASQLSEPFCTQSSRPGSIWVRHDMTPDDLSSLLPVLSMSFCCVLLH